MFNVQIAARQKQKNSLKTKKKNTENTELAWQKGTTGGDQKARPASGKVKSGRRPMTFRWVTEASLSFAAHADASPRARRAGARLPLMGMKPRWDTFKETADMPSCVTAAR